MDNCPRCGFETANALEDGDVCSTCVEEIGMEFQDSMSQMFDAEGNNR